MRILIVDSSVQIMERLEEMLLESATVTEIDKAVSYPGAEILFKQNKPDILLLDIYLPENDSLNILKEINKSRCPPIVVILSGQTGNYIEEQYRLLGANFFFDKYHDFEKIPGLINSIAINLS